MKRMFRFSLPLILTVLALSAGLMFGPDLAGRFAYAVELSKQKAARSQLAELSNPMEKLTGTAEMSAKLSEKGTPVLVQSLHRGMYSINELMAIAEGAVEASAVQVPAGYTLKQLP